MGLGLSNSATTDQFHICVRLLMGLLLVNLSLRFSFYDLK